MSKPLNEVLLSEVFNEKCLARESETLLQVLNLLEILKSKENDKMARISGELSELLENEKNFKKISKAKDLNELLDILVSLQKDKMIKVYENSYLEEKFPTLTKDNFLKIN
ncbi:hypothetical protein [Campylobacter helveticus]|uniref:Uncharacterized protein n=1 Tax=Campylobacter helveticus TaxID=28898 RepID=A0AAX2ULB2_9BACT|nr:hypothetical protein [Campylobacter helveticus]ARE81284.1 hypothetical protein CHELV3228_1722 [Campylobacter helveticus]MCR2039015.1 hypothetical protein [Campylobacter helveticus]MCR2054705.1 hypothetical protein [Campylobacter helveticus]MCR2056531.1 hypothetical protein [Campylobacter helveticus]MCR2059379.1 hypothetical protein [Campylobacter helveticus]